MFTEITLINYNRPLAERAKARKTVGPYKWRPSAPGKGIGFYQSSKGLYMDEHGSPIDLRLDDANEHLSGSRLSMIDGYYCDADGDGDTLQPIVARLPKGRGFLAGWTMGNGMCASLDGHVYTEIEDAARAAHSEAESDAERNREANEAWQDEEDEEDEDEE